MHKSENNLPVQLANVLVRILKDTVHNELLKYLEENPVLSMKKCRLKIGSLCPTNLLTSLVS